MANRVKTMASAAIAVITGRRLGEVEADRAEVRKRLDTAQARLEAARMAREAALDADDEAARRRARDGVLEAEDDVEAALRKLERLEAERNEIAHRDEQAAKTKRAEEALAVRDSAELSVPKELAKIGAGAFAFVKSLAEKEALIATANADLPDGFQPIATITERLLTWRSQPEQVLESHKRQLWCTDAGPLPDEQQKFVEVQDDGTGLLRKRERNVPETTLRVRLRTVLEERLLPAERGQLYSFVGALNLPGLAYEAPYLTPAPSDAPVEVLEHLDRLAAARAPQERKSIRRIQVLPDV